MPMNPHTHRRFFLTCSLEQKQALDAAARRVGASHASVFTLMLKTLTVPPDQLPSAASAFASVRAPYLSGHWYTPKIQGLAHGDESIKGLKATPYVLDIPLDFMYHMMNASEGVRPTHNIEAPWLLSKLFKDGTYRGYLPRDHDEYGHYANQGTKGNVMMQDGTGRRERGFNIHDNPNSNVMHPFLKALWMYWFSTDHKIPTNRAVMLACWAERFCNNIKQIPEFKPQPFDEKYERVTEMFGAKIGTDVISPQQCMQERTPLLEAGHWVWDLMLPKNKRAF